VLDWQAGDSFDYSIVLASLLIGSGYEAFCVYGSAPKRITTNDESLLPCPEPLDYTDDNNEEVDPDEAKMELKKEVKEFKVAGFGIPQKPHLES
jgi:hypothetical protein